MGGKQQEINFQPIRKKFKLCFALKRTVGRSFVQVNRPPNTVIPVTPKSYDETIKKPENLQECVEKSTVKLPKVKYKEPITENQVYGWYDATIPKNDPLLYHGRKLDPMLNENLMNFAKIRST